MDSKRDTDIRSEILRILEVVKLKVKKIMENEEWERNTTGEILQINIDNGWLDYILNKIKSSEEIKKIWSNVLQNRAYVGVFNGYLEFHKDDELTKENCLKQKNIRLMMLNKKFKMRDDVKLLVEKLTTKGILIMLEEDEDEYR